MKETLNEDQSKTCNASYQEEEEDTGQTSLSLEAIVVTKPKEGFLDNELFSDDNMDISDDTLRNNIKSIANLKVEDLEIYEIMNDSSKDLDAYRIDNTPGFLD